MSPGIKFLESELKRHFRENSPCALVMRHVPNTGHIKASEKHEFARIRSDRLAVGYDGRNFSMIKFNDGNQDLIVMGPRYRAVLGLEPMMDERSALLFIYSAKIGVIRNCRKAGEREEME